jgi:hypothetical protein
MNDSWSVLHTHDPCQSSTGQADPQEMKPGPINAAAILLTRYPAKRG